MQSQVAQSASQVTRHQLAPPRLLRCLIMSWSDRRMRLLRAAADTEAWDTIACSDSSQFLRNIFLQKVKLTLVDLPPSGTASHDVFRMAAQRAKEISDTLVVVSVAEADAHDELWARQLGVWSYLPEMNQKEGWELVFREARQALARQASAYLESTAIESPALKSTGKTAMPSDKTNRAKKSTSKKKS